MYVDFLGFCENIHFHLTSAIAIFGLLYISASGHSVRHQAFSCYLGNYLLGCDPAGVILIETEARINDPSNVKTLAFHGLFFIYFRSFQTIYVINPVDFGGIRTWIVRV